MRVRCVAIDWSGSSRDGEQRKTIFAAEAYDGELVGKPKNWSIRSEIAEWLLLESERDRNLVVGFDFSFSLPAWYLGRLGISSARELWKRMHDEALTDEMKNLGLRAWLRKPAPPFWSDSKEHSGLTPDQEFRRTEQTIQRPGVQPKSVFHLGGPGQVGRASLYGMQQLHRLTKKEKGLRSRIEMKGPVP